MRDLARRDFLRLAAISSGALALRPFLHALPAAHAPDGSRKNILLIVFDALSASNMSLLGYGRETTPNLSRLADRAIVYHNHFAAANFTSPSTASLFTGVLPWSHGVLDINQGIATRLLDISLFPLFSDHYRIAYSHNPLVYTFLQQVRPQLEGYVPIERLLLTYDALVERFFFRDNDIASLAWRRIVKKEFNNQHAYSLLLSDLYAAERSITLSELQEAFPLGLPFIRDDNYFTLEEAIDFLAEQLLGSPRPFLAYYHFIPPHEPYRAPRGLSGRFAGDGYLPPRKPKDVFRTQRKMTFEALQQPRRSYDEYVLYVDREFGRLFELLEEAGILSDTWLILTSDHGELFERAIVGHVTPLLYQSVIRVPLLIFEPGRTSRLDIRDNTSTIDVLPTLLHLFKERPATWSEGRVLPPFGGSAVESARSIYAVFAKGNKSGRALERASTMLVQGPHKLTHFFGYQQLAGKERTELYDLVEDPEELTNLYDTRSLLASKMLMEIKDRLSDVNRARSSS